MTRIIRVLLAAMASLVAFGAFTSTAPALNIDPGGDITMVSLGKMVMDSIIDIDCNATFTGDLFTTAADTANTQIGRIETLTLADCDGAPEAGGLASPRNPWPIRLNAAWSGPSSSLPIEIDDLGVELENIPFIGPCLYAGDPAFSIATDGDGTTLLVTSLQTTLNFIDGEDSCPATMRIIGTFRLTPAQELDL